MEAMQQEQAHDVAPIMVGEPMSANVNRSAVLADADELLASIGGQAQVLRVDSTTRFWVWFHPHTIPTGLRFVRVSRNTRVCLILRNRPMDYERADCFIED